jgi:hypothetical protein
MLPDFITIHQRALPAFDIISAGERDAVVTKITALRDLPKAQWATEGVHRGKGPVYFMTVGEDLVVFFSVLPDRRFVIEDFVRQETLERFFATSQKSAAQT